MFKSIRGRLQAWYALVLLTVVGSFAGILLIQIRQARFQDIDRQLQSALLYLDANLRHFPVSELDPSRPEPPPAPPRPEKHFDKGLKKGPPPEKRDKGFPPDRKEKIPGPGPSPGLPPARGKPREQLLAELALPDEFSVSAEDRPCFVVWRADGTVLKSSIPASELSVSDQGWTAFFDRPHLLYRGKNREAVMVGPEGTKIFVGRPVARELAEFSAYAWQVFGTGGVVLGIGLLGGWLISGRIVRPIVLISSTASAISGNNLSGRIDTDKVDSELAKLASVLNAMFQRLQLEFERQARFTADASHELRTPLAVIHSNTQLALSRTRTAEEYRATIESCQRASRRMVSLVDGLLTLARADADKLPLDRRPVDLRRLILDNIAMLQPMAESKGVAISTDLVPLVIQGDGQRLGQVVTNLLSNAIRYNHTQGQIHVLLRVEGKEALVEVTDTGCGIPDADQPHLFERFFRVDKARSRESGGNGLGLAICKGIIEAHGGSVGFTSKANKGTTFWVRLPF